HIDNTGGSLQAAGDLVVASAGVLDNSAGHLSAGGSLAIFDPRGDTDPAAKTLAIVNGGGSLTAGKVMMLDAARLGFDGRIVSRGDFAAALQGDYVHGAAPDFYQASGSVSLAFTGTLVNDIAWHVGAGLSLSAGQIVNGPNGQISSDATTVVQAVSGALTNRGSIHGNTVAALGRELDNRGGHITGNTLAAEFSGNADNRQGRIDFTGAADVYVGGTLDNDGGRIDTGSLALAVGGNLTSRIATEQTAYRSADRERFAGRRLGWGETLVTQTIPGPRAGITARTGDLTLDVGGDLVVQSADLTAAGDLGGYVAGEIGVSAAALASHTHVQSINAGSSWAESGFNAETYSRTESSVEHLPAAIRAGGDLALIAGGGAFYQGSDVSAGGNLTLGAVRGNLQIAAAQNTRHAESTRIGEGSSETTTDSASLAGGRLDAGGDLRLLAGADLSLSGVDASAGGQLWAVAGQNLSAASLPIVTTTTIHTQSAEAPSGEDESGRNSTPAETTSTRTTTTQHGGHFSAPEGIVFDAGHGNPFASAPAAASAPT
ncbi:MAG: hemagglutinin repeat-containing protein, partial [Rhodocyclaceae bacterium]